jgi:altronate hydrolase
MTPAPVIRLHPDDGVLIARSSLPPGMMVAEGVTTVERIPAGHKVAIKPIAQGEAVIRYGQIIGFATQPIAPGQHIHTQNCGMGDFAKDYAYGVDVKPVPNFDLPATFDGIRRPDGRIATRNYIGILTSVNCSAHVAGLVADVFKKNPFTGDNPLADFPNVDGVVALTHKTGCGMTQDEPLKLLRRTLGGYARHVNFSAVVVLGLGCEVNQIGGLMEEQKLAGRLRSMDIQEKGGTRKTTEAGIAFVKEALADANKVKREPVPASELTVALQCLMRWWEDYTKREGAEMNANPSPGNKAGGLTTILEKSLGAMAKAGSTNLVDVLHYAEPVTKKGFVFMDTPGYDPVAATGQVAGGANLVCFTTGRGSVFGCKPAPSIKLATNTPMYERMEDDMDVNCGTILDGKETVQECGQRIFELMLKTASGQPTKSESFDFGGAEFAPWVLGATM